MGKAARARARRQSAAASDQDAERPASQSSRAGWSAFGALAVAVAVIVVIAVDKKSPAVVTPPATVISVADRDAPPSLIAAAAKIGFHPNVEAGVGVIENEPASSPHPPINPGPARGRVGCTGLPAAHAAGPGVQPRLRAWQRGSRRVLRDLVPPLRRRGAAPERSLRGASALRHARGLPRDQRRRRAAPSVYAYHRYFGLPFPALLDPSSVPGSWTSPGNAGPVTTAYRVANYPALYVLNPRGVIVWRSDGEQPDALLRDELLRAAAER